MLMIVSRLYTSRFPQGKAIVAGSKVQFCRLSCKHAAYTEFLCQEKL